MRKGMEQALEALDYIAKDGRKEGREGGRESGTECGCTVRRKKQENRRCICVVLWRTGREARHSRRKAGWSEEKKGENESGTRKRW